MVLRPTGACRKEAGTMQNEAAVAAEASARCLSAFLAVEWGNIRLCSLMFAYVRFFGKKMFEGAARRQIEDDPSTSDQQGYPIDSTSLYLWCFRVVCAANDRLIWNRRRAA